MPASIGGYNDPQQLQAVKVFTTSNIPGTYDNGPTLNGVMATLTTDATIIIIDGYTLHLFDRLILAGQTDSTQNGVYFYSGTDPDSGFIVLQRAPDFQSGQQIVSGIFGVVIAGNSNDGTVFTVEAPTPFRVGKDTVTFNFIKGSGQGVTYPLKPSLGGTGIANADANTLTLNAPTVIDSRGIITSPTMVSFSAFPSGTISNVTGQGTGYVIVFDSTKYNNGNAYNTSTGFFTAPVAGNYLFTGCIVIDGIANDNTTMFGFLDSNLITQGIFFFNNTTAQLQASGSNEIQFSGATILKMSPGDIMGLAVQVSGHATKNISINPSTTFSGQLIG